MIGKHDEKLDSGISSLAKCSGCKATGRIIIGSKSELRKKKKKIPIKKITAKNSPGFNPHYLCDASMGDVYGVFFFFFLDGDSSDSTFYLISNQSINKIIN